MIATALIIVALGKFVKDCAVAYAILKKAALCQILLMGHFRRRPVLAPGAAFFQFPFPFDAIGSGR